MLTKKRHQTSKATMAVRATPRTGDAFKQLLKRHGVARADVTGLTGFSQRTVAAWAAGTQPSPAAQRQLVELQRLFDALSDLMETRYVGEWLKTPNPAFDGSTPLQVIERGEGDRIWRMVSQLETGEPV